MLGSTRGDLSICCQWGLGPSKEAVYRPQSCRGLGCTRTPIRRDTLYGRLVCIALLKPHALAGAGSCLGLDCWGRHVDYPLLRPVHRQGVPAVVPVCDRQRGGSRCCRACRRLSSCLLGATQPSLILGGLAEVVQLGSPLHLPLFLPTPGMVVWQVMR